MPKEIEQNHKQFNVDIAVLKTDVSHIRDEVTEIKNNHLPHIYEALSAHKNWLIGVLVAVILSLIATIANFIK